MLVNIKNKLKLMVCIVVALVALCSFPVEENNQFSELESVWQWLLVYSIYQWDDTSWVPADPYIFSSPNELMEAIPDTLHGGHFTVYDVETQSSMGATASHSLANTAPTVLVDTLTDATVLVTITEFAYGRTADEFIAVLPSIAEFPFLIIDVRQNTGGYIDQVQPIIEAFLPRGSKYINAREREYNEDTREAKTVTHYWITEDPIDPALQDKTVTILMDEYSASASEILIVALKEGLDAVLIGDTSFGKGIGQREIPRRKRPTLKITYLQLWGVERIGVYHRKGIAPDRYIVNDPEVEDDQALIAAIRVNEPYVSPIRRVKSVGKRLIQPEMVVEKCHDEG